MRMWIVTAVLNWFTGDTLKSVLETVENSVDNETERQRIKGDVTQEWIRASVARANSKQWWFALFFVVPLGAWFTSVCLYSMFLCKDCIFPQTWTVAALPPPLDEWSWAIIVAVCGVAGWQGRR